MILKIDPEDFIFLADRLDRIEHKLDDLAKNQRQWAAWYSWETYAAVMGGRKKFYQNNPQLCPEKHSDGPSSRLIFRGEDVARYSCMTRDQMIAEHDTRKKAAVRAFREKHGFKVV